MLEFLDFWFADGVLFALFQWALGLLLILIALLGADGARGSFAGLIGLIATLVTAPIRFLRLVAESLTSETKERREAGDNRPGSFLLVRVGRLLFAGVLVSTAGIAASGIDTTFEEAFPESLRIWRAENKAEIERVEERLDELLVRRDSFEILLADSVARVRVQEELETAEARLSELGEIGFDLRRAPGVWSPLVDYFYDEAWRSFTDRSDNVYYDPARIQRHRDAVDSWADETRELAEEGRISDGMGDSVQVLVPAFVSYAERRLALADSMVSVQQRLDAHRDMDSALEEVVSEGRQAEQELEKLEADRRANHLFSSSRDGLAPLIATVIGLILWVWFSGVLAEAAMIIVGIGRDLSEVREAIAGGEQPSLIRSGAPPSAPRPAGLLAKSFLRNQPTSQTAQRDQVRDRPVAVEVDTEVAPDRAGLSAPSRSEVGREAQPKSVNEPVSHGGKPRETLYSNGTIKERGSVNAEGVWDGPYETFHDNGALWQRGTMRSGEWEGDFEMFKFDGELLAKGKYRLGDKVGSWYERGRTKDYGS